MAFSSLQTLSLSLPPPPPPPPPPTTTTTFWNSIATSSLPPPKPPHIRRKNFLRHKILKTNLDPNQPSPTILPFQSQTLPLDLLHTNPNPTTPTSSQQQLLIGIDSTIIEQEPSFQIHSQPPTLSTVLPLQSPRAFFNLALCFLGMFAFQTLCTLWILGSADIDGDGTPGDSAQTLGSLSDEVEFEKKVSEIRGLAREAREIEKRKLRSVGPVANSRTGGDGGNGVVVQTVSTCSFRDDVRKEVDRRLFALKKAATRSRPRSTLVSGSSNLEVKDGNSMRSKKPARKSVLSVPRNEPKEFRERSKSRKVSRFRDEGNESGLVDCGELSDSVLRRILLRIQENENDGRDALSGVGLLEDMNFFRALHKKFENEGEGAVKKWMEKKLQSMDLSNGRDVSGSTDTVGERSANEQVASISSIEKGDSSVDSFQNNPSSTRNNIYDKNHAVENYKGGGYQNESALNETNSRKLERKIYEHSKDAKESYTKTSSHSSSISNSQLQRINGKTSIPNKVKVNKSNVDKSFWWLELPCIFAVLLHSGSDNESSGGLYSLKINSHSGSGGQSSHTITFQDQSDAANFCYLLESYFEELGDVTADIVPLKVKELAKEVQSDGLRVIVVRKGQIKLYAGQPLEDVEKSLRSIIE